MADGLTLRAPLVRQERPRRLSRRAGHRFVARPQRPFLQRSVVKAAYVKNAAGKAWAAHARYLEREGAQREGARGVGFGSGTEEQSLSRSARAWQDAGDKLVWKLIVSPEQAHRMDLRAHTRDLMGEVATKLESQLEWVAIEHQNTDNAHVHILLRGRREDGSVLEIDSEFIKHGFREKSQELATRELGYRTQRDYEQSIEQEVVALRRTSLDRMLRSRADERGRVRVSFLPPRHAGRAFRRRQELGRLQVLRDLGLAAKEGPFSWRLEPGYEGLLQELQQVGDIQKRVARRAPFIKAPPTDVVRVEPGEGVHVAGRLLGTGLANDLYGRSYLLLEGEEGVVYYVPQTRRVLAARNAGRLHLGDQVRLESVARGVGAHPQAPPYSFAVFRDEEASLRALVQYDEGRRAVQFRTIFGTLLQRTDQPVVRRILATGWLETIMALADLSQQEELTMEELERFVTGAGSPVQKMTPIEGRRYRGRFVGYASGATAERLAVVHDGRSFLAFETSRKGDLRPGSQVQATATRAGEQLAWRLDDLERLKEVERGRT